MVIAGYDLWVFLDVGLLLVLAWNVAFVVSSVVWWGNLRALVQLDVVVPLTLICHNICGLVQHIIMEVIYDSSARLCSFLVFLNIHTTVCGIIFFVSLCVFSLLFVACIKCCQFSL